TMFDHARGAHWGGDDRQATAACFQRHLRPTLFQSRENEDIAGPIEITETGRKRHKLNAMAGSLGYGSDKGRLAIADNQQFSLDAAPTPGFQQFGNALAHAGCANEEGPE